MFSLILPFHSDANRLRSSLKQVQTEGTKYKIAEVIMCHNSPWGEGVKQEAETILSEFRGLNLKLLHTDTKGIGAGYKIGIQAAREEFCILSGSDLPFGFTDVESFLKQNPLPVFAVGSKANKNSQIPGYDFKRKLASRAFWLLRAIYLGLNTPGDTQGSLIIKKNIATSLLGECVSDNYFFNVEIITHALRRKIEVLELPVRLINHVGESSVSVVRDGWKMFSDLNKFAQQLRIKK